MEGARRKINPIRAGDLYHTNKWGDIKVLEVESSTKVLVEFINTGTITETSYSQIRKGGVRDRYMPVVCGVGYIGCGSHKAKISNTQSNPAYDIWRQMLNRCYNKNHEKYHRYGQRGYTVCEEWHNFQKYADWYMENSITDFQVDKDLTSPNHKEYSPENCSFVPSQINVMLTSNNARRGECPVGVHKWKNKRDGMKQYTAHISRKCEGGGCGENLGYFYTAEEAFQCYKNAKEKQIKTIAGKHRERGEITEAVYQTLMNWEVIPYPH